MPIIISRSALGKSLVWRKYFWGRSSPKNTTSGLTVAAQKVHMGTLSFIIACCEIRKHYCGIKCSELLNLNVCSPWGRLYLSLLSRVRSVAQVTGSCSKTTVSLHKFVIWNATHCEESYSILRRTLRANDDINSGLQIFFYITYIKCKVHRLAHVQRSPHQSWGIYISDIIKQHMCWCGDHKDIKITP